MARIFLAREGEMKDRYPQSVKNAKHNGDPSKARNKDMQDTALVAQPDSAAPAPAPEPADSTTDSVTRFKKLKGLPKAELVSFEAFEGEKRRILDAL